MKKISVVIFILIVYFVNASQSQDAEKNNGSSNSILLVDSIEIANVYAKGKLPVKYGQPDTLGVRVKKNIPGVYTSKIKIQIQNRRPPFDYRFDTTIYYSGINVTDTVYNLRMPSSLFPRLDLVIVQAVPNDLYDGTDNIMQYCYNTTGDAYNYADPCIPDAGGFGFTGISGNFVARFNNNSTSPFPIYYVDHSFFNPIGGGLISYNIVIYGDNGAGKPGALLHISPILVSPPGTGFQQSVTYTLAAPVNVPANKKFYVGYRQLGATSLKASYQHEAPIRPKTFFFSKPSGSSVWYDFSDSLLNFRLDISPRTNLKLFLKAYLEGFYSRSSMLPDIVKAEARSTTSPYSLLEMDTTVLNSGGTGSYEFYTLSSGSSYYFAIKHRNHLETWSRIYTGFNEQYNFTDSITKAYGNNMKNESGSFSLFGGDVNQDGIIDGSDGALIDNDAANFLSGYLPTDVNGDNFIDGGDAVIADNNAYNFITVVRP